MITIEGENVYIRLQNADGVATVIEKKPIEGGISVP